jgi:succinate dehydrogenase/fumarate reductase-like Fe-S protein
MPCSRNKRTGRFQPHRWDRIKDWIGDRNVINGTMSFYVWKCKRCGDESEECPEGWEDPREIEADHWRDRMRDGA